MMVWCLFVFLILRGSHREMIRGRKDGLQKDGRGLNGRAVGWMRWRAISLDGALIPRIMDSDCSLPNLSCQLPHLRMPQFLGKSKLFGCDCWRDLAERFHASSAY